MKKNNWLVPGLIALGLILILLSIWSPEKKIQFGFSNKIARILEASGNVKIQNNSMLSEINAKINHQIEIRDILKTDANSEALIEFSNNGQFRIAEKSEILLDTLDNNNPVIVIRTGEIYIEKFGKSPSFWIRKEGQIYSALDYTLTDKKNSDHLKEPRPEQNTKNQISQIEIDNVLNSKRNDFFKCFGQLIQRNPQASGQLLISFVIENTGYTSKIEILKSEILDAHFKSCLIEIVARTRFRAYSGASIATIFPLKFE